MRKRIGTKIYDTDTAVLVDTLDDGVLVYRKTGRSQEVFIYNPNGKNKHEMFFDVPEDEAQKYLPEEELSDKVYGSTKMVQFSPNDIVRLKAHAYANGMSIRQFILMLVDRYEKEQQ